VSQQKYFKRAYIFRVANTGSTPETISYISICTGVGGLDIGFELAVGNAVPVCLVEREAFACAVLLARMEDESISPCPIFSDLESFPSEQFSGRVDAIIGGFPCQDHSSAGKRKGLEGDKGKVWYSVLRMVEVIRPRYCFFENVSNILNTAFRSIGSDLHGLGYTIAARVITAEEVGASHLRQRLFILAELDNPSGDGLLRTKLDYRPDPEGRKRQVRHAAQPSCASVPLGDSGDYRHGRQFVRRLHDETGQTKEQIIESSCTPISIFAPGPESDEWNDVLLRNPELRPAISQAEIESAVCGMADGLAASLADNRIDRIRACGNGVVPLQACLAFRLLVRDLHEFRESQT
jgi:DNA (cytosine-5)-methyltransferase 1